MIKVEPKTDVFCGDCWYYNQIATPKQYCDNGLCRRNPPTAMPRGRVDDPHFILAQYPMVHKTNPICGEFVEK